MKRTSKIILTAIIYTFSIQSGFAQHACDDYYNETKGSPGTVLLRYNEDGTVKGFSLYQEQGFRRNTNSLIAAARRRAEAGINQIWASFVNTNHSAEELYTDSVSEEVVTTDIEESLLINEVSTQLIIISQNRSASISGFVKMDECVDVEAMKVSVTYAWKPEFSKAVGDANRLMERSRNEDSDTFSRQPQQSSDQNSQSPQSPQSPQSRRTRSDIVF